LNHATFNHAGLRSGRSPQLVHFARESLHEHARLLEVAERPKT